MAILLLLAVPVQAQLMRSTLDLAQPFTCTQEIAQDFTGSIAGWSTLVDDADCAIAHDAVSNEIQRTFIATPCGFSTGEARFDTTDLTGDNGYVLVTVSDLVNPNDWFEGLIFRYQSGAQPGTANRIFRQVATGLLQMNGDELDTCFTWPAVVAGDEIGIRWSGLGAALVTQVFHNPVGTDADAWGAPACTFTGCAGACDDTGRRVGLVFNSNAPNVAAERIAYDTFRAGTCTGAQPIGDAWAQGGDAWTAGDSWQ